MGEAQLKENGLVVINGRKEPEKPAEAESKPFCGSECDYCKRMEAGIADMLGIVKKMEHSVSVAKTVIIGLTDENMRLKAEIRRRLTRRN